MEEGEIKMLSHIFENLYQGDMHDAIGVAQNGKLIQAIVYLGQDMPKTIAFNRKVPVVHIPLNDGKNDAERIDLALVLISYLESDTRVLVACRQGASRSIALCSAYLFIYKTHFKNGFDACLDIVREVAGQADSDEVPNPELIESIKEAIETYWGSK